ncbi:hypothetical protein [Kitasatospora sp. CB01950]|nr:hypothetical protein [Kitasatospora sp. CB01950]
MIAARETDRVYGADCTLGTNSVAAWGEVPGNASSAQDITTSLSN